jgi:hypothetical protein
MRLILFLSLLLGLVMTRAALADGGAAAEMGRPGHLAIDGTFSVALGYASTSPPMGSTTSTTVFSLSPTLDYFVAPGVSIGGTVVLQRASETQPGSTADASLTTYGIGPRVGYHAAIGPQLSVWPRAGIVYAQSTLGLTGSPDTSSSRFQAVLSAPFLYHPVPHFFLGLGPEIRVDLTSKESTGGMDMDAEKQTQLAFVSTIGGWF